MSEIRMVPAVMRRVDPDVSEFSSMRTLDEMVDGLRLDEENAKKAKQILFYLEEQYCGSEMAFVEMARGMSGMGRFIHDVSVLFRLGSTRVHKCVAICGLSMEQADSVEQTIRDARAYWVEVGV